MTRLQLVNLISGLINNNQTGEVSTGDVRDALMAVYDSGILNAGGSGGVNLPIDVTDVYTLDNTLTTLNANNISMMDVMGWMSYHVTPYQHVKSQIPIFISEEMQVYGEAPYIDLVTTNNSIEDGSIRFSDWLDGMGAEINYDSGNSLIKMEYLTNGAVVSTLALHEDGHITANDISPTDDTHLITYGAYKRLEPPRIASTIATGKITRPECILAMNTAGYPFDTDVVFYVEDGDKFVRVSYFANGDTDESGLLYKFMVINAEEAI